LSIVVDASVLVALVSDAGPEGQWAEGLLGRHALIAPDLALVESTNVLRRLEIAGKLERFEAASAASDLLDIELRLLPFTPFAERVWALRGNLTSYDALYVAIAERLDLALATLDRRLSEAPGPTCRFLLPGVTG
jgi:predicted nucleic acid-binding protein